MPIIDASRLHTEAEQLSKNVQVECERFAREKDWPPELVAQAMLAIVYGTCRKHMSHAQTVQTAGEQFTACERAFRRAKPV